MSTETSHTTDTARLLDGVRVVVSGSFRRDHDELAADFSELRELGAAILSPIDIAFVADVDGFVLAAHEVGEAPEKVQQRHVLALQQADMVWLHCPQGYVGPSAALELGVAHAFGVPVFARRLPDDVTLRHFARAVAGPAEALSLAAKAGAHTPAAPLRALQDYYLRVARERGYESESARDTLLLLTEEMGELARAVRKTVGLARTEAYPSDNAAAELADVQLYLLHLANIMGISMSDAVSAKERLNAARTASEGGEQAASTDEAETATTTTALFRGRVMYLDDRLGEGERVTLRADFDDDNSGEIGTFTLHRDGAQWVLR